MEGVFAGAGLNSIEVENDVSELEEAVGFIAPNTNGVAAGSNLLLDADALVVFNTGALKSKVGNDDKGRDVAVLRALTCAEVDGKTGVTLQVKSKVGREEASATSALTLGSVSVASFLSPTASTFGSFGTANVKADATADVAKFNTGVGAASGAEAGFKGVGFPSGW